MRRARGRDAFREPGGWSPRCRACPTGSPLGSGPGRINAVTKAHPTPGWVRTRAAHRANRGMIGALCGAEDESTDGGSSRLERTDHRRVPGQRGSGRRAVRRRAWCSSTTSAAAPGHPRVAPLAYLPSDSGDAVYIFASKGGAPTNPTGTATSSLPGRRSSSRVRRSLSGHRRRGDGAGAATRSSPSRCAGCRPSVSMPKTAGVRVIPVLRLDPVDQPLSVCRCGPSSCAASPRLRPPAAGEAA